jgi:alpha-L-rhamnosidase
MRVIIDNEPFGGLSEAPWDGGQAWPCHWIGLPNQAAPPWVAAFRLRFRLAEPANTRLHVSADERYELFLDGARLGRGPTRCQPAAWAYESYALDLTAGEHVLVARVWALGELAPFAQISLYPGFVLCAEAEALHQLLNTGRAPWEVLPIPGYVFTPPLAAFGAGATEQIDGARFPWSFEYGEGTGWLSAATLEPAYSAATRNDAGPRNHLLAPSPLPAMIEQERLAGMVRHISAPPAGATHAIPLRDADNLVAEYAAWNGLLLGDVPLTLDAHSRRRVILDLDDYVCAYPELLVSGGAEANVRLHWQESLFENPKQWTRGPRDVVEDRFFTTIWHHKDGYGDSWRLDGGSDRRLDTLWWRAGRFLELLVETAAEPLTIKRFRLRETRYPLEAESFWTSDDPQLDEVARICLRTLQCCTHETFMDCPHYEQLMYIGDARVEGLLTYALSRDSRLPRRVLTLLDGARAPDGLIFSRTPSRRRQLIPPFALWWVAMLHDHLYWRGEPAFVATLLPGARTILDRFLALQGPEGLVRSAVGWNYGDWYPGWAYGVPPGGEPGGISPLLNWQLAYVLERAAALEELCGIHVYGERWRGAAARIVNALDERFWAAGRGVYAEDEAGTIFCEQSQALAALCISLADVRRVALAEALATQRDLLPASVYFAHYVFEAMALNGRGAAIIARLGPWREMVAFDFKTTYENNSPQSNRSDCHAWAAHPLLHFYTSILGIRPVAPGFAAVTIAPSLGALTHAQGTLVHPRGSIQVTVERSGDALHGEVALPEGVTGTLLLDGQTISLGAGRTTF